MGSSIRDLSVFHEHNAIREAVGEFVIVRHHQDRQRVLIDHLSQQPEQFMRANRVEISGGLVSQQHFRIVRQRPRDRDSLLFTAGQFRRLMRQTIAKPTRASTTERVRRCCPRRPPKVRAQRSRARSSGTVEVLKDHSDRNGGSAIFFREWPERLRRKEHFALARVIEPAKHVQRRLARIPKSLIATNSPLADLE